VGGGPPVVRGTPVVGPTSHRSFALGRCCGLQRGVSGKVLVRHPVAHTSLFGPRGTVRLQSGAYRDTSGSSPRGQARQLR
jgi:hypothetical protein